MMTGWPYASPPHVPQPPVSTQVWRGGGRRGLPLSDVITCCWLLWVLKAHSLSWGGGCFFWVCRRLVCWELFLLPLLKASHPLACLLKVPLFRCSKLGVTLLHQPTAGPFASWDNSWECSCTQAPISRGHMASFLSGSPRACLLWLEVRSKYHRQGSHGAAAAGGWQGKQKKVVKRENVPHSNQLLLSRKSSVLASLFQSFYNCQWVTF